MATDQYTVTADGRLVEGTPQQNNVSPSQPAANPARPAWMSPPAGTTAPSSAPGSKIQPNQATPAPASNYDGKQRLRAMLAAYGLEAMTDRAWAYYQNETPTEDEFAYWLRQQPEYANRYPGMARLREEGRAISEAEYINLERQYKQLFRQAGLPEGFYDQPDDFASYIANEVSPVEMRERLDIARTALYETPPQVREQLARIYNLREGDVMAYLLDAEKALPVIQQQFAAATAAAASGLSGYGMLTRSEAERIGVYGRSFDQLAQGFDQLARSTELFQPIIGETGDTIGREDQLDAAFGGNSRARRRIERQAANRVAAFAGGGGYAESSTGGVTGLGSATT